MQKDKVLVAFLHKICCSQKDFRIFFYENQYTPTSIYEKIKHNNLQDLSWIREDRKKKIMDNFHKYTLEKISEIIDKHHIKIITRDEEEYPKKLLEISNSPYILYIRGELIPKGLTFAIVGSRKSTQYGQNFLEVFFNDLPKNTINIISGGATGIDGLSHKLALEKDIYTLSVFGSGIDIYYPSNHAKLFDQIINSGGGVLSIFPIGTKPEPYMFPVRNEIVSGLSDGIIIPEAGKKSGTLITARLGLEQGKEVFAVPGDIFRESSAGCNELISRGEAKCTTCITDILEEYIPTLPTQHERPEKIFSSPQGKNIFQIIENGNNTHESIMKNISIPLHELMTELALLEIDGHVSLDGTGQYHCIYS